MPRLSVVIPAYNNADYIAATMDSILEQDFTDFELVVADHSSTDSTLEVLEPYRCDPRVRIISTPAGGGAPANWRRVSEQATGELLKLVCGDDVLYPGALTAQVAAFDEHPKSVLVASRRDILDARGVPLISARGLDGLLGVVDGRTAVRATIRGGTNLFGEPACVMVRRSDLEAAGGWNGDDPYLIDEATYAAVLFRGPMVGLAGPHAGFRVNDGQWSVALAAAQSAQVRSFHRRTADAQPGLLRRSDLVIGNVRASVLAIARRAVYVIFARRLRAPRA